MKQPEKIYKMTAGASRTTLKERGLFGKTIPLAIEQARKAGFKYVFSYCGIIQSRKACHRAGLRVIA
jgi:predicted ABC-type ATPase